MPYNTGPLGHFARKYRWQQSFNPMTSPKVTFDAGQVKLRSNFQINIFTKITYFLLRISSGFQICYLFSCTMRTTSKITSQKKNGVINFSLYVTNTFFIRSIGFVCGNCILIQGNRKVV